VANLIDRVAHDLAVEFKAFSFSGQQSRLAACASLGGAGSVLVAVALHLDNPWWAGITAVSILQSHVAATLTRSVERAIGTLAGALVGYVAAPAIDQHLPFQILCAVIVAFTVYGQERSSRSYTVLLGGVTALLVLFGTLSEPDQALHLAVYRSLEVLVGIVVGCLVSYVFHPVPGGASVDAAKPGIFTRPVDIELLSLAVTGGIALALIPDIWETFQLPGFSQTPITAFVIVTAMRRDPGLKALTRALGCLAGGLFGIVAASLVGDALLPWLASLAFGLYVAGFVQHGGGDASYLGQQAAVALLVALVQGPEPSPDLAPAIDRLVGIFGGILVVSALTALLGPIRLWMLRRLSPS
jgi:uncharacterized membrane protein YccC